MIKKRVKTNDGEPLTLDGLMSELNNLFVSRKDDPKAVDIKSMIQSLVNGEACFEEEDEQPVEEGIDISNEDLSGGIVGYDSFRDAINAEGQIMVKDAVGDSVPAIAFVSSESMMEGVVDTIRAMKMPTIVAAETTEGGICIIDKAFVVCCDTHPKFIKEHGFINGFVFDEKKGGMCRMSINRKDGYDFIIGENKNTRFIIFDEAVCPATIPADIIADDRKWGKRMSSELPKLIEQRIEESKSEEKLPFADAVQPALTKIDIPNLTEKKPIKAVITPFPETCAFEDTPDANIKQPIIGDIMKEFADAKKFGKVGKDTFVEFMKPENKEAVASAVATSIAERQNPSADVIEKDEVTKAVESAIFEEEEDDFSEEDTNPDCFRCIAEYMAKEGVDSVHFYTDVEGLIHCDVQRKTIYKVELDDSEKK